jgi:hypothetical protein
MYDIDICGTSVQNKIVLINTDVNSIYSNPNKKLNSFVSKVTLSRSVAVWENVQWLRINSSPCTGIPVRVQQKNYSVIFNFRTQHAMTYVYSLSLFLPPPPSNSVINEISGFHCLQKMITMTQLYFNVNLQIILLRVGGRRGSLGLLPVFWHVPLFSEATRNYTKRCITLANSSLLVSTHCSQR